MHVLCVYHLHVAAHLSQSKTAFANMGGLYKANAGRIHYVKFSLGHEHLEHLRMLFTRLKSAIEFFMYIMKALG